MGKTVKPLLIIALPPCHTWPELDELEAKGHRIIRVRVDSCALPIADLLDADIVLGSHCWRMTSDHKKYLALAIKQARLLRYPTKEERANESNRYSAESIVDSCSDGEQDSSH